MIMNSLSQCREYTSLQAAVCLQELRMFYLLQREKEINLHPRFFGPKLLDTLTAQLRAEVCRLHMGTICVSHALLQNYHRSVSV